MYKMPSSTNFFSDAWACDAASQDDFDREHGFIENGHALLIASPSLFADRQELESRLFALARELKCPEDNGFDGSVIAKIGYQFATKSHQEQKCVPVNSGTGMRCLISVVIPERPDVLVSQKLAEQTLYPAASFAQLDKNSFRYEFFLHHEIAHGLLDRKINDHAFAKEWRSIDSDSMVRAEYACDSYAILRHISKYGFDTGFPEFMARVREAEALKAFRRSTYTFPIHYTSNGILETVLRAKRDSVHRLSPPQMFAAAIDIACAASLPRETMILGLFNKAGLLAGSPSPMLPLFLYSADFDHPADQHRPAINNPKNQKIIPAP